MQEHLIGENKLEVVEMRSETSTKNPIVFVHMSWGAAWAFKMYMKYFSEKGYPCYVLSLRGHGKSGGTVKGATMQNYVNDIAAVVDHFNLVNPIVLGHSMGGLLTLMYGSQHPAAALISMDGSPTYDVTQTTIEMKFPDAYTAVDAGMPILEMEAVEAFPDMDKGMIMKMKEMLGVESGVARAERKRGISVSKDSLHSPLLFVGAENGTSVPFGIGIEKAKAQAEHYNAPVVEIKDASHPGLLIGKHWMEATTAVADWLSEIGL
jgi:pimeloyl-ACP methyl ester carboxylesterase